MWIPCTKRLQPVEDTVTGEWVSPQELQRRSRAREVGKIAAMFAPWAGYLVGYVSVAKQDPDRPQGTNNLGRTLQRTTQPHYSSVPERVPTPKVVFADTSEHVDRAAGKKPYDRDRTVGQTNILRAVEVGQAAGLVPKWQRGEHGTFHFPVTPAARPRGNPHLSYFPETVASVPLAVHCWVPHLTGQGREGSPEGALTLVRLAVANGVPLTVQSADWRPDEGLGSDAIAGYSDVLRFLSVADFASRLQEDVVVISVDCEGSLLLSTPAEILRVFKSFDADFVLSAEAELYPDSRAWAARKVFMDDSPWTSEGAAHYPSGHVTAAYAGAWRELHGAVMSGDAMARFLALEAPAVCGKNLGGCESASGPASLNRILQSLALRHLGGASNTGAHGGSRRVAIDYEGGLSFTVKGGGGLSAEEHGLHCLGMPRYKGLQFEGRPDCEDSPAKRPEEGGDGAGEEGVHEEDDQQDSVHGTTEGGVIRKDESPDEPERRKCSYPWREEQARAQARLPLGICSGPRGSTPAFLHFSPDEVGARQEIASMLGVLSADAGRELAAQCFGV